MTTALFSRAAVEQFMDESGLGAGPLEGTRIGEGQANVTFRLQRAADVYALRRPPLPPFPPSAHDVLREARFLTALKTAGAPVPRVLAVCVDESVLGVPFFIMDYIDGVALTSSLPAGLDPPHQRRRIAESAVDALARIHELEWTDTALAQFGRPDGYLERQIRRFSALWDANATRDLPAVATLGAWLESTRPATQRVTVVHGDYRLGNLMYAPTAPARILAVLDWEMATIGDPLADLGYLVATYSDAQSAGTPLELTPVTRSPGFPAAAELIDIYRERTGQPVDRLDWYQVLALWKAAVFCEAIFGRWARGERPRDDPFARSLEHGVPQLLAVAGGIADRQS